MTNKLRGAVVGFGRMGMTHYSILKPHPKVEFVGLCEPSSFIRKNVDKYLDVKSYADFDQMLADTEPNFVIVATPTGLHADCALRSIHQGAHIFMEKPLALTANDGQQILAALDERPVINQVGYVIRFNDIFLAIRRLLPPPSGS